MKTVQQWMDQAHHVPGSIFNSHSSGDARIVKKTVLAIGGIESMTRRLVALWNLLPEHHQKLGFAWYDEAHDFACDLARTYDLSVWQVSQVIAVLSPQNPWEAVYALDGKKYKDGNKECAIKVISTWYEHGASAVHELRGWGYAPAFLEKAIAVLEGEELDWSGAPKTHRFAMLIANPHRLDIVVCDSHASRIATGNIGDCYHVVTKAAYPLIEEAYSLAASILGIPAYVLQAGLWQYAVDGHIYSVKEKGQAS